MSDKQPTATVTTVAAASETNALNLRWCFGFNSSSASTVHSLSTPSRNAIFYVTAHTGVIHDLTHDVQYLLQGHENEITSVCISRDKRWIITADYGESAMIVVWDAQKATPVKIIPQPAEYGGVAAMDLSADAMFLVTLSYAYPQTLAIWEWPSNATATTSTNGATSTSATSSTITPIITAPLGASRDYSHCVRFNPVDVRDIVTNGASEVVFWNWSQDTISAFHPPKGMTKLKKGMRDFSQTTFIPYTTKAVTATQNGYIIAWDYPVSELIQSTGRDAIKILKLVKEGGINLLDTVLDKFIVCGCSDGAVRFYDFQFRVVAWFEDIQAGMITSVSFAMQSNAGGGAALVNGTTNGNDTNANGNTNKEQQQQQQQQSQQGQVSMEEFSVPDFIVSTSEGKILQLDSKTMEYLTPDKRRGKLLVQGFDGYVDALDAHPSLPLFAVGTVKGSLQIWDVDEKKMVAFRKFEAGEASGVGQQQQGQNGANANAAKPAINTATGAKNPVGKSGAAGASSSTTQSTSKEELINTSSNLTCIKFGPRGVLLAIGFSNGFIKLVSSIESSFIDIPLLNLAPNLKDICSFHRSESSITNIVFSQDGNWFASSDSDGCIAVYRYYYRDEEKEKGVVEWIYLGKYKAHYRPVVEMFFESGSTVTVNKDVSASSSEEEKDSDFPSNPLRKTTTTTTTRATIPRLYSLGEDRVLQEYDLVNSSIRTGLQISSSIRLEQTACPTAMMNLRIQQQQGGKKNSGANQDGKNLIITANDEYKLKIWEITEKDGAGGEEAATANSKLKQNKKVAASAKVSTSSSADTDSLSSQLHNTGNKHCRSTLLAPLYGGAIKKLFNLPKRETQQNGSSNLMQNSNNNTAGANVTSSGRSSIVQSEYLVYSTFSKIIGLIKLPLDGNPHKHMALLAHPGEITQIVSTFDGKYVLTAGGRDRSINLFHVNTASLDACITLGGEGITPYMSLIDGGVEGEFYQDLLNYFVYSQLRTSSSGSEGGNSIKSQTDARKINGYITLDESINLLRALGFYPTEYQIELMKSEVRYENMELERVRAAEYVPSVLNPYIPPSQSVLDRVSLDVFLRLYINHRPVFGLGPKVFEDAFRKLSTSASSNNGAAAGSGALTKESLIQQLMTVGDEPMSAEEIDLCLSALMGGDGGNEKKKKGSGKNNESSASVLQSLLSRLPSHITPQTFARDLLGFEDYTSHDMSSSDVVDVEPIATSSPPPITVTASAASSNSTIASPTKKNARTARFAQDEQHEEAKEQIVNKPTTASNARITIARAK